MRNTLMIITAVFAIISTNMFASVETMPDIGSFDWDMGDDFSDLNYSFNNWNKDIPSAITYGINASDHYGYLRGDYSSGAVSGEIAPTQGSDICGIRADVRLSSLTMLSGSAAYCALGIDITPNASLYWGFTVLNGQLNGNLLFEQYGSASIIHGDADFSAVIGQTYNLAIVFDEIAKEYYLYLNGEKKTSVYFPDNETSFSFGHFKMYTQKTYSRVEFDNVEFATVPEPTTLILLGLGGLFIRKHQS